MPARGAFFTGTLHQNLRPSSKFEGDSSARYCWITTSRIGICKALAPEWDESIDSFDVLCFRARHCSKRSGSTGCPSLTVSSPIRQRDMPLLWPFAFGKRGRVGVTGWTPSSLQDKFLTFHFSLQDRTDGSEEAGSWDTSET